MADVDGIKEDRRGTWSVFNGPEPEIRVLDTPEAEAEAVGRWVATRVGEGVKPEELAVFVRSPTEVHDAPGEGPGVPSRRGDGVR
jgi:hypothetical protein